MLGADAVDLPQLLLEQVRPVEPRVGSLDHRELGLLAVGEVLGVLPDREASAFELSREREVAGAARLVSDRAADLV